MDTILHLFSDPASKYGPFANVVQAAGFAMAAALALGLGWMPRRGSRWVPPEEAVSKGITAVASLGTAVVLIFLYAFFRDPGSRLVLGILALVSLALAIAGLVWTTYLMKAFGVTVQVRGWFGRMKSATKLGGPKLTPEAEALRAQKKTSIQRLVEEANGDLSHVFDPAAMASVHSRATMGFLALQMFGSIALGAAGLLLSLTPQQTG